MSKHICLMPPNWLGDVIMAQPAMHAVSQAFPEAKLTISGQTWLADILPFLQLAQATYAQPLAKADAVYIFRNSFSAAWQAWRAGIQERHGFAHDGRSLLLRPAYRPRFNMRHDHHRRYFLDLVRQAGIVAPDDAAVSLHVPDAERQAGREQLSAQGLNPQRCICVAPGAQFGGAKRYPDQAYRQVLKQLSAAGWQLLVLGTPAEKDIANACLHDVQGKHWNACGQTSLRQALQILAASRLLLCNDSGLMHVAAGFGMPVVALFGATDPQRTAPDGAHVRLLYRPAPCSPCLQRECRVAGHPCMQALTPQYVTEACLQGLAHSQP